MQRKFKKSIFILLPLVALASCGRGSSFSSTSSTSSSSSSSLESSSSSTTSSSSSSSSSTSSSSSFPEGETVDAYYEALEMIRDADNYSVSYTLEETEYTDIYANTYMYVGSGNGGYIELASYNSTDPLLGDTLLYTFVYENDVPTLGLPVTKTDWTGLSVAHSLAEVNYITKALIVRYTSSKSHPIHGLCNT